MNMKKILYIGMMLLTSVMLSAQSHSYYCDFEDAAENANWTLNKPKNEGYTWVNQWTIGNKIASLGEQSMYISPDGGEHVGYKKTESRVMIAWREMNMAAGRYDLAFDWMCGGDSARAALLVAWVPESQFGEMFCMLNDDYKAKKWVNDNMLKFNKSEILTGGSVWTHAVTEIVSDGQPHRLVYLFVYGSSAQLVQPGPCVDNIQVCRNNCGVPTNMGAKVSNMVATLQWTSSAEEFNFRIHRMGENVATLVKGIKKKEMTATLKEGVYDIQIQVICQGDTSVWYNFPTIFVYETECIDYLDLTNDNCFFSSETASNYKDNINLPKGKIDYGFTSMWSRHTIHYRPEEYDMRTYGSVDSEDNPVEPLKTVPNGAIASVRIGSWEKMARVARVEYEFEVDADKASVLMMQYAMVLESSGHNEEARPRLTIDIVDAATGKALSPCTTVDLAAQTTGAGWNRVPDAAYPDGSRDVCWRDWTTLGLYLAEFDKTKVKVIVTVMGCTAEIHYGYAYFTLTCTSGQIQGLQCGWTPTNEFIAPEGFNYRWYLQDMPSETLSRERIYPVDYRDTRDYAVDVTYKSNDKCGFTLTANAIPRFPIPQATYKLEQRDCGNYITFTNISHIRTRNWITGKETDTPYPTEYVTWTFDGLEPEGLDTQEARWSPSFRLPDEEADYHFTLTAGVGLCDSTQHFYIHVPRAGKDTTKEDVQRCEGDLYNYKGKFYQKDTVIVDLNRNLAGCDSVHMITLRFVDAIRDTAELTITEGESYQFGTQTLTETFASKAGCDSIVNLTLHVVQPLVIELSSIESPCPEAASFHIETHAQKGIPEYYKLNFGEAGYAIGFMPQADSLHNGKDNSIEVSMPSTVKPGYYPFEIAFSSEENGDTKVEGELVIYYSASLIQQRWDDVLGILREDYNGGYDFTSFQWYRNGSAIKDATDSYYFTPDKLQPGDEYVVELKQPGEERGLKTCAYVVPAPAQSVPVKSQKILQNGQLRIVIGDKLYNAQGVLIETDR